jgi:hypothetical protein
MLFSIFKHVEQNSRFYLRKKKGATIAAMGGGQGVLLLTSLCELRLPLLLRIVFS